MCIKVENLSTLYFVLNKLLVYSITDHWIKNKPNKDPLEYCEE